MHSSKNKSSQYTVSFEGMSSPHSPPRHRQCHSYQIHPQRNGSTRPSFPMAYQISRDVRPSWAGAAEGWSVYRQPLESLASSCYYRHRLMRRMKRSGLGRSRAWGWLVSWSIVVVDRIGKIMARGREPEHFSMHDVAWRRREGNKQTIMAFGSHDNNGLGYSGGEVPQAVLW